MGVVLAFSKHKDTALPPKTPNPHSKVDIVSSDDINGMIHIEACIPRKALPALYKLLRKA